MGFFKNIGNAFGDALKGDFKEAGNTLLGKGSGGGTSDADLRKQAETQVLLTYMLEFQKMAMSKGFDSKTAAAQAKSAAEAYKKTAEYAAKVEALYKQLKAGQSSDSSAVGNILKSVVDSAVSGLNKGLESGIGHAVDTGLKTGTSKVLGTGTAATIKEQLADFGSQVMDSSIVKWLKKNWVFVIIPFGLLLYFFLRTVFPSLFNAKSGGGGAKIRYK